MNKEQKEKIYKEYSADNMKKLRKVIGKQTSRFNKGCGKEWINKDYDEFLSMANMELWKILEKFDETKNDSFDNYLQTMMVKKMKQTCTWINRDKRMQYARDKNGEKIKENGKYILIEDVSIESEISDGITVADSLKSNFDTFDEAFSEKEVDEKVERYIERLSILQRKIVDLLCAGYKKSEIIAKLHMSNREYTNNIAVIKSCENIRILKS